ncbi:MAG: site-specific DNA-methyltransferase [Labilithrix sp.]|nr:site-specific DNA-methyltransferase [Labilithrix sp.]
MDSRPSRRDRMSAPSLEAALRARSPRAHARTARDERENLLIHGDNLAALRSLSPRFAGKIRCAYLDPPYNTGRTFAEYSDALAADDWVAMMRPRLEAIAPLLADDGAIFVQIDDTQLAHLALTMDAIFGAKNRISTITVVRSATTGHKAINAGPVHVSDFILAYARDKKRWRYRPQTRVREGLDPAYATWLDDPDAPPARWTFRPLRAAIASMLGHDSSRAAVRAMGKLDFEQMVALRALESARHVVRFAQPRYEAIARAAQQIVDRSRERPERVFVHEREGRPPFIVKGGNRILFLADKVRVVGRRAAIVEPLTNVWTDMPFQGIAREGGVVFTRNKKPERLVARVVAMASDPGDWVLDPFLGSGTTAAVAHKMSRRWIGIESGDHLATLAEPRLRRVIAGEDATGITGETGFRGGGSFRKVVM